MASDDNIFDNLNTRTLSSVSGADFDLITDPIHIEKANAEALKTSNLIWDAAFHDGNPMPGGISLETVTVTDNTRTTVWTPGTGVVQLLGGASAELDNNTGSVQVQLFAFDGDNLVYLSSISSSTSPIALAQDCDAWPPFMYFSDDVVLQVVATGTFDAVKIICQAIRLR